jgi:hypothetical protein
VFVGNSHLRQAYKASLCDFKQHLTLFEPQGACNCSFYNAARGCALPHGHAIDGKSTAHFSNGATVHALFNTQPLYEAVDMHFSWGSVDTVTAIAGNSMYWARGYIGPCIRDGCTSHGEFPIAVSAVRAGLSEAGFQGQVIWATNWLDHGPNSGPVHDWHALVQSKL